MSGRTWSDDALRTAVAKNVSIAGVLRDLGLSRSPGNYKVISLRISDLNIPCDHVKGKAHGTSSGRRRDVCVACGIGPEWQGRPLTLQLDHANGDPYDNRLENLRILCPNCHARTTSFTGRHKRGRYVTPPTVCRDCGTKAARKSLRCRSCFTRLVIARKGWPDAEELAAEVVATSYKETAARLGVSTIGIRRHLCRCGKRPRVQRGPKKLVATSRVERLSPVLQTGAE